MTLEDLERHFGSFYKAAKDMGLSYQNIINWKQRGYIPIVSQMKIQVATEEKLKADLGHCTRIENERKGTDRA